MTGPILTLLGVLVVIWYMASDSLSNSISIDLDDVVEGLERIGLFLLAMTAIGVIVKILMVTVELSPVLFISAVVAFIVYGLVRG